MLPLFGLVLPANNGAKVWYIEFVMCFVNAFGKGKKERKCTLVGMHACTTTQTHVLVFISILIS